MRRLVPLFSLLLLLPSAALADEPAPKGVRVDTPTPAVTTSPESPDLGGVQLPLLPSRQRAVDLLEVDVSAPLSEEERQVRRDLDRRMHEELAELRRRTRVEVARLTVDLARADAAEAGQKQELERGIEAAKTGELIEALRIQARFAREVGADAIAAELDAAAKRMLTPVDEKIDVDPTRSERRPAPRR